MALMGYELRSTERSARHFKVKVDSDTEPWGKLHLIVARPVRERFGCVRRSWELAERVSSHGVTITTPWVTLTLFGVRDWSA